MIPVLLEWGEFEEAASVGFRRGLFVVYRSHRDDEQKVRPHYGAHIEGAVAEKVCSKAFDCYWPAHLVPNKGAGDMTYRGKQIEARYTRHATGRLLVHDDDPDEHIGVLVRGCFPHFEILGGIQVAAAKREDWWDEKLPRPAYAAPQSALKGPDAW